VDAVRAPRAGVHGSGEHEPRGECDGDGGASDSHRAVFEWPAHNFKHVALKFRQFVEEQDAVVAQGDFSI
jgi:hypothetical protein